MRKITPPKGSILIWSLFLGISLTTVFFFLSQRLNASAASQRETIQYQNARLFLESYADYLEGLNAATLATLRGNIDFEGITGTLTNETETITGMLDAGASVTYLATPGSDNIRVEWDACPSDDTEIIEINGSPTTPTENLCATSTYDKAIETTEANIKLKALAGPTSYKLTQTGDAKLYDNEWQLDLEMTLGFRRKITLSRTFTP